MSVKKRNPATNKGSQNPFSDLYDFDHSFCSLVIPDRLDHFDKF